MAREKSNEDPDLLLSQIGLRITQRRQELGWSQKELAERVGSAPNNLYRIEHGLQNITVRTMVKIASVLDVTAGELFTGRK